MASIQKKIAIHAPAEKVWSAIRDIANTHELFKGVVTQTRLEEGARIVTFANGMEVRESIIGIDDAAKRFAYTAVGGSAKHHNASLQVTGEGESCEVTWITDVLPDEIVSRIQPLMDMGAVAMKKSMERG